MLLVQGLRDKIVAPFNAVNLAARIRQAGGEVDYITYPKRGTPRWSWLSRRPITGSRRC
jgi:acetyl esterase/lipase